MIIVQENSDIRQFMQEHKIKDINTLILFLIDYYKKTEVKNVRQKRNNSK